MFSGRRHWSRLSARFCCTRKSWSSRLKIFTKVLINNQLFKTQNSLVIAVAVKALVKAKNSKKLKKRARNLIELMHFFKIKLV
jgi:hypothetical protein